MTFYVFLSSLTRFLEHCHQAVEAASAPVGEWRDDESFSAAEEFVHVREVDVSD